MTEKQGGSDVRANTTTARPLNGGGPGGEYEITGHKWFFSAPMCDAFLVLAQAEGGLSCFLLPRFTPDGERNRIHLQRLKDKLGNRSNASSEVEFRGAWAQLVGEEGRGVPTIIEMVNHTRLDCALGCGRGHALGHGGGDPPLHPPGGVRQAAGRAAADAERARRPRRSSRRRRRSRAMRLARTFDEADGRRRAARHRDPAPRHAGAQVLDLQARPGPRRRGPGVPGRQRVRRGVRACRGSTGRARWPRSGRARGTSNASTSCARWRGTRRRSRRSSPRSRRRAARSPGRRAVAALRDELSDPGEESSPAPARVVERMALALQASLLVRYGDPAVADAFCASRLERRLGPGVRHPARRRRLRPHHRAPLAARLSGRAAGLQPALVEPADHRLGEADGVGRACRSPTFSGDVGGPVVVGRLLEVGAGAERGAVG